MRHLKRLTGVALALALAAGCGAGDPGAFEDADYGELGGDAVAQAGDGAALGDARPAGAAAAELARIEFPDGNSVRFEELEGGILVTEVGSELNPRHLVPREGMSALAAFRELAPNREVPAALARLHERIYPERALDAEGIQSTAPGKALRATPDDAELPLDPDLEHNGQFQQSGGSYPAANFIANMCDFPNTAPNFRSTNHTAAHTKTTPDIHTAYFATASDIGIITARACANNNCGNTVTLQAGFHSSGFYDAGNKCDETCCLFGLCGCVSICTPRKVSFAQVSGKISSSVRFHECGAFTR
ncbi:MAG TPA: hypothetical protein VFZ53_25750 [Polyangiaceae bacterium]